MGDSEVFALSSPSKSSAMNSPAKSFGMAKDMPLKGGLQMHGLGSSNMQLGGGGMGMMTKENVKPNQKWQYSFNVIDYNQKPDEGTGQFNSMNGSSQIQIGVMDPGNFNKDSEQNREIDMNELNALLGN